MSIAKKREPMMMIPKASSKGRMITEQCSWHDILAP